MPFTQFPLILTSCITVVHLSKLKKSALVHYYKLNSSFHSDFPGFYTNVLFLFKDSIQDTTLPLVIMCPEPHWSVTISGSFLVFHNLDSSEEYWSVFRRKPLNLRLSDVSLLIRLELWLFSINDLLKNTL